MMHNAIAMYVRDVVDIIGYPLGDLLSPRLAAMMLLESASRSLLLALVGWEPTAGFGGRRTLIGLQLDQHDPVCPNFSRLGRPIAIGYWNEGWGELENLPLGY
jgi:hypothetical protein